MRYVRQIVRLMVFGLIMQESAIATAQTGSGACKLDIGSPADGSTVIPSTPVTGRISESAAAVSGGNVWVIIHPDGDFYWVQQQGKVVNGQWRVAAHFGDGQTPTGFHFEVLALVAPTTLLNTGAKLNNFPAAACSSNKIDLYMK